MKKLFLIPLLTLVCSVMAWGATVQVGDFDALKTAISKASDGDVIELTTSISGSYYYAMPTVGFTIDLKENDLEITGSGITFSIGYMSGSAPITIKNGRILSTGTANYPITFSASTADCILEDVVIQSGVKAAIKAEANSLTIKGTNTIPSIELGGNNLPMTNQSILTTSIISSGCTLNLTNNGTFTFGANTLYSKNAAPTITNNGTIAIEAGAAFTDAAWAVVSSYKNPAHVAEKWAMSSSVLGKKIFASTPDYVAKIGSEEYASFDAAFLDARLSGESKTIQLLSDANLLNGFSFGNYNVDITVDLNNHTLAMGNNYIWQSPTSGTPSQKLAFENGTITSNATAIFKLSPSQAFIPELSLNNVTLTNTYNQSNALISKRGIGIETTGKAKIALLGTTTATVRWTSLFNLSNFDLNNEALCHVYILGTTNTTANHLAYIGDNSLLEKFGAENSWWEIQTGLILPAVKEAYTSHIKGNCASGETYTSAGPTGDKKNYYKITEENLDPVATVNGVNYYDFFTALDASSETYPAILQTNVYVSGLSALTGQNRYVDLNGYTIEQAGLMLEMNKIENGKLHFLGNGTVTTTAPFYIFGSSDASAVDYSVLEIAAGVTVTYDASFENYAIWVAQNASNKAYGVRVDLAGTVNSNVGGAYINGNIKTASEHAPIFNISGTLNAAHSGIYAAGYGIWNISGTVNGNDAFGIGIKAGKLNVTNNAVIYGGATSEFERVDAFGNGMNISGATLQIESNGSYGGNMEISIADNATLSSANNTYAIYEYVDKYNSPTKVNSIAVTGGKFQGGILISQALAAKGGFVSGGKWSKDVAAHIKVGENLSLLNNEDDDNPPYLYLVGVPTPAQEADYAEKDASNNAVLTNSASQSAAESYSSDNVGENPDVITTKETNPVVVSENTDVVATETAPIVEVKTLTVESDDDQLAVLTVTNGATLKVGAGAVHLGENAQLVVEQGAALIVDGLIYGATEDNLVIKSSEANAGILLFSPETEFISEDHPAASVKLYTQSKQVSTYPLYDYLWQRFAIPVIAATIPSNDYVNQTLFDGETGFETYLFGWGGQGWVQPANGWLGLEPNKGYQLANNTRNGGITYTFEGNLIGNHDGNYSFESTGFEFFGNSYTAPIYVRHLLSQIESQSDLEATINVYDMEHDRFLAMKTATFQDFDEGFDDVEIFEEIASMQAFILKGNAGVTAEMSYANAIWENPRFNPSNSNPAPQRRSVSSNRDIVVLNVAANGTKDRIVLRQSDEFSAEFDNSADASKYMNEGTFNIYANTEIGDLAEVSTDELNNTILGFQSAEATEYTLTCSGQKGESFILRDLLTGAEVNLEKGATYTFAQQPNTTNEARFQIVDGRMAPTAVENVQNVKKAEGIYTVLGKYLGAADQLDKLPAGMYIVNGVKIVK